MYDIVIIGAGPAGSNLARLLDQKYRVLLVDRRKFDSSGVKKCCGGLLAPDAQKIIAELGLGIPKEVLVDPQLFAVRTLDLNAGCERLYQRYYYNMDREKFDQWLLSLVPKQVERAENTLYKSHRKKDGFVEVTLLEHGVLRTVKTKVLIGADGANSRVRQNSEGVKASMNHYIAIQAHFSNPSAMPYYTAIFDSETTDFYAWMIPKEDKLLLGAALKLNDDPHGIFKQLTSKLEGFGILDGLRQPILTEGAFINRPRHTRDLLLGSNKVAYVGEAAGAISPSSAEGISYALKSSLKLSKCLNTSLTDYAVAYYYEMASIRRNLMLKRIKSPVMYNPLLRKTVMKAGLMSINPNYDLKVSLPYSQKTATLL